VERLTVRSLGVFSVSWSDLDEGQGGRDGSSMSWSRSWSGIIGGVGLWVEEGGDLEDVDILDTARSLSLSLLRGLEREGDVHERDKE